MWRRSLCLAALVLATFSLAGPGSDPLVADMRVQHHYRLTLVGIDHSFEDVGAEVTAYVYVGRARSEVTVSRDELPVVLFEGTAPSGTALELWVAALAAGDERASGQATLSFVLPYPGPDIEPAQTMEERLTLYSTDDSTPTEVTLTFQLELPRVAAPEPGTVWDIVNISDSTMAGVAEMYAAHLEADLGVSVRVHDWMTGGLNSFSLYLMLLGNEELRADVREAEVITFWGNPSGQIGVFCYSPQSPDRWSPEKLAGYKEELELIIEEIFTLRDGQDTIIRATDFYIAPLQFQRLDSASVYDQCVERMIMVNEATHLAALEHNIPVASLFELFNGPDGDEDPGDKGYIGADREHTNEAGRAAIANMLRELGYEYTIPVSLGLPAAAAQAEIGSVEITWHGHSAFTLAFERGATVLTDPFRFGLFGTRYPIGPMGGIDVVTISHEHEDHNCAELATGDPIVLRGVSATSDVVSIDVTIEGVRFYTVETCHTPEVPCPLSSNAVFVMEGNGLRIAHLGDLGHVLTEEQASAIGIVDVLLVPVGGGVATIDADRANLVVAQLEPQIVIAMHYAPDLGYPIEPIDPFLVGKTVVQIETRSLLITAEELPAEQTVFVLPFE